MAERQLVYYGLARELAKAMAPHLAALADGTAFGMTFSFPITKVDAASRTVEGTATDETVDAHGEILDYGASKNAFAAWEKNIREMHSNQAVGRAVGVLADDRNKRIVVRARISKGAESTWQKILDQTLRYFSVGGTRLRSTMLPNGVRRTDEYRLNEVSLVDVGANPSAQFKIVKSLDGRPTVTDIVASDSEADYYACAEAIEKVAVQLAAACRPLPEEVSRALFLCGSPVVCNALDPFDPGMKGPGIAVDLRACAKAMRMGDDAQAEKGRTAAAGVLLKLPCRRDLAKYRGRTGTGQWGPESRGVTLEGLQAELAKCLDSLRGMRGPLAEEAIAKMETSVMAVHTVRKAAGVASTGLGFTRSELEAMREDIDARLKEWQASGRPRTPEYHTLEGQAFQVRQYLKTGRW